MTLTLVDAQSGAPVSYATVSIRPSAVADSTQNMNFALTDVAAPMIRGGVRGIWNFANMELSLKEKNVVVQNVHMGDSLMTLCFGMKTGGEKGIFDDQI